MIDYEYLCQAIVDWRAGRRPSPPPPLRAAARKVAAPEADLEEMDSSAMVVEHDEYEVAETYQGAYPQYDGTGYEDNEQAGYDHTQNFNSSERNGYDGQGYEQTGYGQPGFDRTLAYVPPDEDDRDR